MTLQINDKAKALLLRNNPSAALKAKYLAIGDCQVALLDSIDKLKWEGR